MAELWIRGGRLLDPVLGTSVLADVLLAGGRVAAVGQLADPPAAAEVIDASGLLVSPGLVDLQVNGAHGVDISAEPERLWEVAAALPAHGVTSFLPTVVSGPAEVRDRLLRTLSRGRPTTMPPGARPLGAHFEGPMLAAEFAGAHAIEHLREPSPELVASWSRASGVVLVTVAPELPGALEVIRALVARGVVVSIGHTAADVDQVDAAVEAGARAVTHLWNAMPRFGQREPGPVGAAMSGGELIAGVIVDGRHVHPRTVAATWRALGPERFLAVSDATAGLDLEFGATMLGDRQVLVDQDGVWLADPLSAAPLTLAGSRTGLDECLRLLIRYTAAPAAVALAAGTWVPARLIGHRGMGRVVAGGPGDVALFDSDLQVRATVVGGRVRHDLDDRASGRESTLGLK